MSNAKIKKVSARNIFDSRRNPTIEIELHTTNGVFYSSAPSGASRGKYEAVAIKAPKAIHNVNEVIAKNLWGKDPVKQKIIDKLMIGLDGTKNKRKLGANAILAVSLAVCRAGAAAKNLPLYSYISKLAEVQPPLTLPLPAFNIINGGAHADNELDIQEFMVVPRKKRFRDNFQTGKDISEKLTKIAEKRFGVVKMGDEGGLSLPVKTSEEALSLISEAIWGKNDIRVILDCAASQFYKKGFYGIAGKRFNKEGLVNYYSGIVKKYPIIGLEDPFAQDDWEGWKMLGSKLKKVLIIGDDLLVTNPKRIRLAKKRNACNGVIIKINQVGTVTEAIEAAKLAKSYGWKIMVSHRSGETMDDFIADFAVGIDADFIKAGAPTRPERLIKYNRLLEIEKEMS